MSNRRIHFHHVIGWTPKSVTARSPAYPDHGSS